MHSQKLACTWLLAILILDLGLVGGQRSPFCIIPDGEFEGLIVNTNTKEPYYGNRCVVRNTLVQVQVKRCMPRYCCQRPEAASGSCSCNDSNIKEQRAECPSNSSIETVSCFVENIYQESMVYGCCSGSVEDEFHVCTNAIDCSVNNGGCDQHCLRNITTGKDYCSCYTGYKLQVVNSAGTVRCKGNGPITSPSAPVQLPAVTEPTPYPLPVVTGPSSLVPYIIAITVGAFLLILLLFLLLLLLCCRRRRQSETHEEKQVSGSVCAKDAIVINTTKVFRDVEKDRGLYGNKVKVIDDDKVSASVNSNINCRVENEYSNDPVGSGVGSNRCVNDKEMSNLENEEDEEWMKKKGGLRNKSLEGDGMYDEIPNNY